MPESRWRIEPLALADCEELGRVHVSVWREAYAGIMPDEYLAGLSPQQFAERWRQRLGDQGSSDLGTTLVATDAAAEIVGFVSAGPSRDDDVPTEWELYAINLLARTHGTGLADKLLGRALGDRGATLWVAADNRRARAFYARHGFVPDGAHKEHPGSGAPEIRMLRSRWRPAW
ncbi:GNAT family N-acetyltransferase [Intrasporangium sp.]|uniref:GNAT family N-acetyltransferase n=1 Tax=Intrasporangium sp. TaxID=1925024 RepID=UPI0032219CF4